MDPWLVYINRRRPEDPKARGILLFRAFFYSMAIENDSTDDQHRNLVWQ